MALTYQAISTVTVGSGGAATIEFTAIPQTFSDLLIVYSARSDNSASNWNNIKLAFNSSTANGSWQYLAGYNNGVAANIVSGQIEAWINFNASTANVFSNSMVYISDYTSSYNKPINIDSITEGNQQDIMRGITAALWSNSAAITAISATPSSGSFMQYSTATLYGIKNS
jgi:hypothetical protein